MGFLQDAPRLAHPFRDDRVLDAWLAHVLPVDRLAACAPDLDALGDAVKWEHSRGGALFPHIYGPLTLDVVVAYSPLAHEPDGSIRLPVTG